MLLETKQTDMVSSYGCTREEIILYMLRTKRKESNPAKSTPPVYAARKFGKATSRHYHPDAKIKVYREETNPKIEH
jgi:hypothetical protein